MNDKHTNKSADGGSIKVKDSQGKDRKDSRQRKRGAGEIMRQSTPQVQVEMEPNPDRNADRTLRNITITISPTKKKVATPAMRKGKQIDRQNDGIIGITVASILIDCANSFPSVHRPRYRSPTGHTCKQIREGI